MTLAKILQIEGITIRLIPMQTVSLYSYREGKELAKNQTMVDINGRKMIREIKENSLGGKYLVRVTSGQGNMVQFNLKHDGIGETIESAYADFVKKN